MAFDQESIFLDAGMPMLAASTLMPMPSYSNNKLVIFFILFWLAFEHGIKMRKIYFFLSDI